jgi:AcrR family transcriptional regulator
MAATEGLRERKKRRTRAAIAAAAMQLFTERGFEAVTVADVARAAEVSEKTVFNYFPAKEDLVFAAGAERRAALVDAVRGRPPGSSVVEPFRALTEAFLDHVERGPVETILAMPRLVRDSRALRDRVLLGWEEEAAMLAPVLAEAAGEPEDSIRAAAAARALAWAHRLVFRAAVRRLLAGEDPRAVAGALRQEAQRTYDLLERGLGGYGCGDG